MDNRIDSIYGRQSLDKKDSISIESQFEFCRYELKGGECKEYKDKGYSGKNIDRPDFTRLLNDIKNGLIKRVIVYKLDRISRSIVDFAKLMELFKAYDVEFVSCTEKFDTSTPMGRAMLNICIVFAQLERESIQQRVTDAFYSRSEKGYYMRGRAPFGFTKQPYEIAGIKTKILVATSDMDNVNWIFTLYAEPHISYKKVAQQLEKHGILIFGKVPTSPTLSYMLRNPIYVRADMDVYDYYKAKGVEIKSPPELFDGEHGLYYYQGRDGENPFIVVAPSLGGVDSGLFLTVQRKLDQNTTFQSGRPAQNTWLVGKLKCGRCGSALSGLKSENDVVYMRCRKRLDNGTCEGAGTLKAHELEQKIYEEMAQKMAAYQTLTGETPTNNPKLTAARAALAKIEKDIENLLDTLTNANPTLLQYANARIEELDAQRQAQAKVVADLQANVVPETQINSIAGFLSSWDDVAFEDKRSVADALMHRVNATENHFAIEWKF